MGFYESGEKAVVARVRLVEVWLKLVEVNQALKEGGLGGLGVWVFVKVARRLLESGRVAMGEGKVRSGSCGRR